VGASARGCAEAKCGWLSIQHEKNGGWGFVIRDAQGAVIRAGAGGEDFLLDAFHSEIIACHAGLKEAARVGLQNIWLETDATQVQMALMTDDFRLSAVGGIITEMKFLISSEFHSCRINTCKRACNEVAHALATVGCSLPSGTNTAWGHVPQE
jgi:hypothetical protein